ncbi:hypothetical protein Scep_003637 [Stephania cephalantha]|uniref:Uncharacterized protein n=1 Tax=Stephania cephalantha TaxID=152367 RepID=A0AAP0KQW0_9MAGN
MYGFTHLFPSSLFFLQRCVGFFRPKSTTALHVCLSPINAIFVIPFFPGLLVQGTPSFYVADSIPPLALHSFCAIYY